MLEINANDKTIIPTLRFHIPSLHLPEKISRDPLSRIWNIHRPSKLEQMPYRPPRGGPMPRPKGISMPRCSALFCMAAR
jgi:hypothetical protein